jgi:hypothetical protein
MTDRRVWTSVLLTLLALAIVYGVGTTFFTIELERLIERAITPRIAASPDVEAMNREVYSGIDRFIASRHIRIVGYACLALVALLAMVGLVVERRGLAVGRALITNCWVTTMAGGLSYE